jgi:hypothetical protein
MTALHGGGEVARYIARHGTKRVAKAVLIVSTAAEDIVPRLSALPAHRKREVDAIQH